MSLKEVTEIELDQSLYGKAFIVWRKEDGTVVHKVPVKWNQRWEAFSKAYSAWYEAKFGPGSR